MALQYAFTQSIERTWEPFDRTAFSLTFLTYLEPLLTAHVYRFRFFTARLVSLSFGKTFVFVFGGDSGSIVHILAWSASALGDGLVFLVGVLVTFVLPKSWVREVGLITNRALVVSPVLVKARASIFDNVIHKRVF